MKLPPKPTDLAMHLWEAWGRACAEAALEAAAKECEVIWAKRRGLESGTAYDAALAIRNIKIEDRRKPPGRP